MFYSRYIADVLVIIEGERKESLPTPKLFSWGLESNMKIKVRAKEKERVW